MDFITLAVFLTGYYREMVFWTHFGAQNRGFRDVDAYQFDIIVCQWHQCILINHRNPFIYVTVHGNLAFMVVT